MHPSEQAGNFNYPQNSSASFKLGSNHDAQVISQKEPAQPEPDYIIVGDKNVTPHDMRIGNQVNSLHYFHLHAEKDQVEAGSLSGDSHVSDVNTFTTLSVLPTFHDCVCMSNNFGHNSEY